MIPKNDIPFVEPPDNIKVSIFIIFYYIYIMSSLNIDSLFEASDNKHLNRLKLFDDILVRIHNRIKYHSQNKWFYCTFNIPEFIIGKPLYKSEDLRKYLIDSLKRDKFDVIYVHPNFLFISWENKKSKRKI